MDKTTTLEPQAQAEPVQPLPGPVDWTKPVRTKGSHYSVTITKTDAPGLQPIRGRIEGAPHLANRMESWGADGSYQVYKSDSALDLENVPEPAGPDPILAALKRLDAACQALGHAALPVWDHVPPAYLREQWEALADALVEAESAIQAAQGKADAA